METEERRRRRDHRAGNLDRRYDEIERERRSEDIDEYEERRAREEQRRREAIRRRRKAQREAQVRRQMMLLGICAIAVIFLLVALIVTAINANKDKQGESGQQDSTVTPSVTPEGENNLPGENSSEQVTPSQEADEDVLHLIAVGDNIIHERVGNSGKSDTGDWSYEHLYQYVKDDIQAADLALVVQETILVEDHDDFTGYPKFGTPTEVADALVDAGFDIVTHATNHTMDKGVDEIQFTIDWWKEHQSQISVLGIHEDTADAEEITVVECNSFKIAMLNYTQLMNFDPDMSGYEYLVDVYEEDSSREDIRRAKELADLVLVVMHAGTEYSTEVDAATQAMTNVFLEEGVDIVIGSHPHVLRPMETLVREDGHEMLVYYSLGNFISCQNELSALLGGMADITIKRDKETGEIYVDSAEMIPLMTHYNHDTQTYAVYKMEDYTEELMLTHSAYLENPGTFSMDYYNNLYQSVLR